MADTHLTLLCEDVEAGACFFRDVLALPVHQRDGLAIDVELGAVTATLTPRATAPTPTPRNASLTQSAPTPEPGPPPGQGKPALILEVEVSDVREAAREMQRRGAEVLVWPVLTEWGTESAFVAGPDGVVVELYRTRKITTRRRTDRRTDEDQPA
jgi:catechol 2,3-dioxygenase-like lactoylglutathione lyase family enzyme